MALSEKSNSWSIILGWILVALSCLLALSLLILFLAKTNPVSTSLNIDPAIFGQYGDVIGGVAGTIVALVGVLFLYETLREQQRQFTALRNSDAIKEELRLSEIKEYLIVSLESFHQSLEIPINNLREFAQQLSTEEIKAPVIKYPRITITAFDWISKADLFKIIYKADLKIPKQDRAAILLKFNNQLDYLKDLNKDYEGDLKDFREFTSKYENKWQESITAISRKKDQMNVQFSKHLVNDPHAEYPFLDGLHKIFTDASKVENYTEFHIALKHFVLPIEKLCKEADYDDDNVLDIINNVNDTMLAYSNLLSVRNLTKFNIVNKARSLRKIEKSMKGLLKFLQTSK